MMAQITRSKKFKLGFSVFAFLASQVLLGAEAERVPSMANVGVIPVQWEGGDAPNLQKMKQTMNKAFSEVVRSSYRFRVLNDSLVDSLWSSPEGRAKLVDEYELDAFMSLSAKLKADTLNLQTRLMSPKLDAHLSEMESISLSWAANADATELRAKLEDLTYRMLNRLPTDMGVIAVQGRFVTLSGGAKQNVKVNDVLEMIRSTVATVHPADGTWVTYKNQQLGKAVVVDVKNLTSVARLTSLSYENAVEVGDGARIVDIESRSRFKRMAQQSQFKDSGPIVLAPMYDEKKPPAKPMVQAVPAKKQAPPLEPAAPMEEQQATIVEAPLPVYEEEQPPHEEGGEFSLTDYLAGRFNDATFVAGMRLWSIGGEASASASLPPWLFNHFGANISGDITRDVGYEGGLFLSLGLTGKSYMGGGFGGRGFYKMDLGANSPVKAARFGMDLGFETINVPEGKFGGGNMLNVGVFAGVLDRTNVSGMNFDWHTDLYLTLMTAGQLGLAGTLEQISGGTGYGLRANAFLPGGKREIEWGAGLKYGSQSIKTSVGSLIFKDNQISLNMRYRF